jgi:hypothetical protein
VAVEGLTEREAGLVATPFWTKPSDQVTFHGPEPVKAAWIVVEFPRQMVAVPVTAAVGRASTVTVALPVIVAEQPPLTVVATTVYVPPAL